MYSNKLSNLFNVNITCKAKIFCSLVCKLQRLGFNQESPTRVLIWLYLSLTMYNGALVCTLWVAKSRVMSLLALILGIREEHKNMLFYGVVHGETHCTVMFVFYFFQVPSPASRRHWQKQDGSWSWQPSRYGSSYTRITCAQQLTSAKTRWADLNKLEQWESLLAFPP